MMKRLLLLISPILLIAVPCLAAVTQVTAPVAITTAINGTAGHLSGQWNPRVAFDGSSTFMVVWEEGANIWNNSVKHIYAARVQLSGNGTLSTLDASGISVTTSTNSQMAPRIAYGGGTFLIVWQELVSGQYEIMGARITSTGTVQDTAGFVISAAGYNQVTPDVCYDPTGNHFFAVWADLRSNSSYQIYGARIGTNGTVIDPSGILLGSEVSGWYSHGPSVGCNGTNFLVTWMRRYGVGQYTGMTGAYVDCVRSGLFNLSGALITQAESLSVDTSIPYGGTSRIGNANLGPAVKTLVDSSNNFAVVGQGVQIQRGCFQYASVIYSISNAGVFNNQQYPAAMDPWGKSIRTDGTSVSSEYFVVWEGTTPSTTQDTETNSTHVIYGVRASPASVQSNAASSQSTDWGSPFTLSTDSSGSSYCPAVATGTAGYVLLVYEHDNMTTPASHVLEASLLSVN